MSVYRTYCKLRVQSRSRPRDTVRDDSRAGTDRLYLHIGSGVHVTCNIRTKNTSELVSGRNLFCSLPIFMTLWRCRSDELDAYWTVTILKPSAQTRILLGCTFQLKGCILSTIATQYMKLHKNQRYLSRSSSNIAVPLKKEVLVSCNDPISCQNLRRFCCTWQLVNCSLPRFNEITLFYRHEYYVIHYTYRCKPVIKLSRVFSAAASANSFPQNDGMPSLACAIYEQIFEMTSSRHAWVDDCFVLTECLIDYFWYLNLTGLAWHVGCEFFVQVL